MTEIQKEWNDAYKLGTTPWRDNDINLEYFLKKFGILSGNALDLGCGTGEWSYWLSKHGFTVEGLDFSSEAIRIAKSKFLGIRFNVWNLEELDQYEFGVSEYDLILDVKTFVFIKDKEKYLRTIRSKLRGVFILRAFLKHEQLENIAISEPEILDMLIKHFNIIDKKTHQSEKSEIGTFLMNKK